MFIIAPQINELIASSSSVRLSWALHPVHDIKDVEVYRKSEDQDKFHQIPYKSNTDSSFLDRDIEDGRYYWYHLVVVDSAGNRSEASENRRVFVQNDFDLKYEGESNLIYDEEKKEAIYAFQPFFKGVKHYMIYKSIDGAPFRSTAIVPQDVFGFSQKVNYKSSVRYFFRPVFQDSRIGPVSGLVEVKK